MIAAKGLGSQGALGRSRNDPPAKRTVRTVQPSAMLSVEREKHVADLTKRKQTDLATKRPKQDAGSEIDAFVQRSRTLQAATGKQLGRLIFALDATASRTTDLGCCL